MSATPHPDFSPLGELTGEVSADWTMPHDDDAERAVLGAVMFTRDALTEARRMLTAEDFYQLKHAVIWKAALDLDDAGRPADPISIVHALGDDLRRIGGHPYLHECMHQAATGNVGWYAEIITDKAYARRVISSGIRLVQIARSSDELDAPLRARIRAEYATLLEAEHKGWTDPAPLGTGAPKPPEFPGNLLPEWIAMQVASVSDYTQTPMDLAGTLALSVLSTACGGRLRVAVRPGEWSEPVNLYTVAALPPGTRKTPAYNAMIPPIKRVEEVLIDQAGPVNAEARAMRKIAEERATRTASEAAKAKPDKRAVAEAEAREAARELAELPEPRDPQLMTDDVSPANLSTLMADNGGRMAILSDESEIFDIMAGRHTSGAPSLNVFLKAHAGSEIRVNRTTRHGESIPNPALTIGVCTQPSVLAAFAAIPGAAGRGLLARWLYTVPEVAIGFRTARPRKADPAIGAEYENTMTALIWSLHYIEDPVTLALAPDAETLIDAAVADYEKRMRDGGDLAGIREWACKAVGAAARIAGLLHIARHLRDDDGWNKPISADTIRAALALMDYYTAHALIAFDAMSTDETITRARAVLEWIERNRPDRFTAREAFSAAYRSRFPRIGDMDAALGVLERHGYIRRLPEPPQTGRGRPSAPTYETHPGIGEGTPYGGHTP